MSENSHVVELDVYVERDGVDAYVGAVELPLRDQEKWREIEGNLVRGQVVEVNRESVGRALLGVTDEDERALDALPGKLEEAAEEHARNWLIDRGMADRPRDTSWRREAVAVLLEDYKQGLASSKWVIAAIESILLWPKGADL
jgi:hypothetical protein